MGTSSTQRDAILAVLLRDRGHWVRALDLSKISLQYASRIWEIRDRLGFAVDNDVQIQTDGTKHGRYRIAAGLPSTSAPAGPTTPTPDRLETAKKWIQQARGEPEREPSLFPENDDVLPERRHRDDG